MNKYQADFSLKKTNNLCLNAIKETESDLGTGDAVELLCHALPLIIERKDLIASALHDADLEKAALHAHKSLGSVRLYGTERLENMLLKLKNKQVQARGLSNFSLELEAEFDSVSFTINEWLSLNKEAA